MKRQRAAMLLLCVAIFCALSNVNGWAQCPVSVVATGMKAPTKIIVSRHGDLLVAEAGNGPNTGRISILEPKTGSRRTLIDGLPSGFSPPASDPTGPSGLALRGNILFVSIGLGDAVIGGRIPGTQVPNPNPSSPIFSSVLALSLDGEETKPVGGFILTLADQFALKNGSRVTLRSGAHRLGVQLVADFPDYFPEPVPGEPDNVRQSNPFGVVVAEDALYIPDASANSLRMVDLEADSFRTLTNFAPFANTRGFGPPIIEAVPNSVRLWHDELLVTMLSGFPFPIGGAQVRIVDPETGEDSPFITGLTSAIDVLPLKKARHETSFLTLEFSADMLAPGAPGRLRFFESRQATPTVVADCLISPTSMALEKQTGDIYVTEIFTGRVVRVSFGQSF